MLQTVVRNSSKRLSCGSVRATLPPRRDGVLFPRGPGCSLREPRRSRRSAWSIVPSASSAPSTAAACSSAVSAVRVQRTSRGARHQMDEPRPCRAERVPSRPAHGRTRSRHSRHVSRARRSRSSARLQERAIHSSTISPGSPVCGGRARLWVDGSSVTQVGVMAPLSHPIPAMQRAEDRAESGESRFRQLEEAHGR